MIRENGDENKSKMTDQGREMHIETSKGRKSESILESIARVPSQTYWVLSWFRRL